MRSVFTAISAILLSTAANAGASDAVATATATVTFESLDKNADQQISRTEAAGEKMLADAFAFIDTNGDGYISKAEYAAAHTKS
jgi:Ca2+-binding EF-hand superfamily protein